jgi:hypothetical protein
MLVNLDDIPADQLQAEVFHQSLFQLLAKTNNIDTYSYLYEVMMQSELNYFNPQGLVVDFIKQQEFDIDGFSKAISSVLIEEKLQQMVKNELFDNSDLDTDLSNNNVLKQLLLKAYQLGQKESS